MVNWTKQVAAGAAGLIVGSIAINLLPEINTSSDLVNALNNPAVRLLLIAIVVYAVLTNGFGWLTRLLSKDEGREPYTPYQGSRPDRGTIVGEVQYEGVNWPFVWGETRRTYHGWVDRPNCPECGSELDSDRKHRRVRSTKELWDCPACGFTTDRRDVADQRDSVQKIVEQEADRIIQALLTVQKPEVESMLEDIEDTATDIESGATLEFLEPQLGMNRDEREALGDAVEGVVDGDDLQNPDKTLVLDHLLGQYYGPRDQYDVIWWDGDHQSVNRALGHRS